MTVTDALTRLRAALDRCRDGVSDTDDCLRDLMRAAEAVLAHAGDPGGE